MAFNYDAVTPSNAQTVTNSEAPAGFSLIGVNTTEEVPRQAIPTLVGGIRAVGLPVVGWQISYFRMTAIGAAGITKRKIDGTATLTLGTTAFDNVLHIGGSLRFQDIGRGILACNYSQNIISLGQRADYGT